MKREMLVVALACTIAWGCAPESNPGGYDGFVDTAVDTGTDTGGGDAPCTSSAPYCSGDFTSILACDPGSGDVTTVQVCAVGEACVSAACVPVACVPGSYECIDDTTLRVCAADGSGTEDIICPGDQTCNPDTGMCEEICKVRIFILLDKSGSMADSGKWTQARTALSTLMTGPTAEDVEFGFGVFPTFANCGVDNIVIHPVPDATASIVDSYFASTSPNGGTPLTFAVEAMLEGTDMNLDDPAYHNAILVVSDGMDSCYIDCATTCAFAPNPFECILTCEDDIEEMATPMLAAYAATLRDDRQIRTFVIGFGGDVSDVELSALAVNGGTAVGAWIPATDVDALTAALATIVDEMAQCNDIII